MTERDFKILKKVAEKQNELSDMVQVQLPFNRTFIKSFRDKSTHQYGKITDVIAHACLMHCVDENTMNAIKILIESYNKPEALQTKGNEGTYDQI